MQIDGQLGQITKTDSFYQTKTCPKFQRSSKAEPFYHIKGTCGYGK